MLKEQTQENCRTRRTVSQNQPTPRHQIPSLCHTISITRILITHTCICTYHGLPLYTSTSHTLTVWSRQTLLCLDTRLLILDCVYVIAILIISSCHGSLNKQTFKIYPQAKCLTYCSFYISGNKPIEQILSLLFCGVVNGTEKHKKKSVTVTIIQKAHK